MPLLRPAGPDRSFHFTRSITRRSARSTVAVLTKLSAMTPSPTHRRIPSAPRYRQRRRPWRRLSTLIRPSQPTRQRWPRRNHRCRSCARRAGVLRPGRGKTTRRTPRAIAASSFARRRKARSPAARSGARPKIGRWRSSAGIQRVMSAGRRGMDLVRRDDLMLAFLNRDELAELGGLGDLALANRFGVRLEDAEHFVGHVRVAAEQPRPRLGEDARHERPHLLQPLRARAATSSRPPRRRPRAAGRSGGPSSRRPGGPRASWPSAGGNC